MNDDCVVRRDHDVRCRTDREEMDNMSKDTHKLKPIRP